jgi:hypothetical protein
LKPPKGMKGWPGMSTTLFVSPLWPEVAAYTFYSSIPTRRQNYQS